jgi:putative chitinase
LDRAKFFSSVRTTVFGGRLSLSQVSGIEALLDACDRYGVADARHVAYVLATPTIETGMTFEPISENLSYSAEGLLRTFPRYFTRTDAKAYARQPSRIANRAYGGRMGNGPEPSGDGWTFRGRGYVQITGRDNYRKFSELLGIDLERLPEYALKPEIAAKIAVIGMRDGVFTGHRLSDYFGRSTDWVNARRIINSTDRADDIARYAKAFHAAIQGAA